MRDRSALVAAKLSLFLTAILIFRIITIGNPEAFVILVPALAGGLLAIWRPGRAVLIASAFLTVVTAGVSLIGGVGLLYIPSIVLFIRGAVSPERQHGATQAA